MFNTVLLKAGSGTPSATTGCRAHLALSGRLYILAHAKEVVRVVLALHLGETIVVRAIGGAHAKFTPRTTSVEVVQQAMTAGRLSIIASHILRALS